MSTRDNLVNDQGLSVAHIIDGEVFSNEDQRKLGTIRGNHLYDMNGRHVGSLSHVGAAPSISSEEFEKFLKGD
jgi:hypothetical protein